MFKDVYTKLLSPIHTHTIKLLLNGYKLVRTCIVKDMLYICCISKFRSSTTEKLIKSILEKMSGICNSKVLQFYESCKICVPCELSGCIIHVICLQFYLDLTNAITRLSVDES